MAIDPEKLVDIVSKYPHPRSPSLRVELENDGTIEAQFDLDRRYASLDRICIGMMWIDQEMEVTGVDYPGSLIQIRCRFKGDKSGLETCTAIFEVIPDDGSSEGRLTDLEVGKRLGVEDISEIAATQNS